MKKCLVALSAALLFAGCGHTVTRTTTPPAVHPPGWAIEGPPPSELLTVAPRQTATMYDTTTIGTVPNDPFALAGYVGGWWPTFGPLTRTWPRAHTVSIAINAKERAACLDVEPGDATPGQVAAWDRGQQRAGVERPCDYSDWSEWVNEIRPALERAGIHRSEVWEWDAFYNGRPHIDPSFDGTQYTDRCLGRNLDCSLVSKAFLSIARPPLVAKRPPAPKPKPSPSKRRAELKALLGAYSKRNPHGYNCQKPPYRHAYPSARYNRACLAWARELKTLTR